MEGFHLSAEPRKSLCVGRKASVDEDNLNGKGVIRTYNTSENYKDIRIVNSLDSVYTISITSECEGEFDNDCYHRQLTKTETLILLWYL